MTTDLPPFTMPSPPSATAASNWTVTMLAKLHETFGPKAGHRPGVRRHGNLVHRQAPRAASVGAMLKPIGTEEAHGLLVRALKQMRWRYNTEEHARRACTKSIRECDAEEVLSTLLLHRAGSYPGQVSTTDYNTWLLSGWNITKRKHRHVDGLFTLPIAARWHRNFPSLELPDQNCGKVQMSGVPPFEVVPKTRLIMERYESHNESTTFVSHSSSCGPPPDAHMHAAPLDPTHSHASTHACTPRLPIHRPMGILYTAFQCLVDEQLW